MQRKIDLTGRRFGMLVALRYKFYSRPLQSKWEMQCDCGNTTEITVTAAKNVKSCGCLKLRTRHGMCRQGKVSSEYSIWGAMIQRCTNPNSTAYSYYGGRGITVCERWTKFDNFYADMGNRPSKEHSIDRIDNGGNYCPENCEWADKQQQSVNRRSGTVAELRRRLVIAEARIRELEAEIGRAKVNMKKCK